MSGWKGVTSGRCGQWLLGVVSRVGAWSVWCEWGWASAGPVSRNVLHQQPSRVRTRSVGSFRASRQPSHCAVLCSCLLNSQHNISSNYASGHGMELWAGAARSKPAAGELLLSVTSSEGQPFVTLYLESKLGRANG